RSWQPWAMRHNPFGIGQTTGRIAVLFTIIVSSVCDVARAGTDANASTSPHAKVQPVGLGEVHWTRGFWADRFELCRTQMIPNMERLMEGTNYSQYFQNFRIAAGLT